MVQKTILAVDLGTTCSAVVALAVEDGRELLNPESKIRKISNYPREPARSGREPSREAIPSLIWYGPQGQIEIGYQVTERRAESIRDDTDEGVYLEDWKLLLDESENTKELRAKLRCKLDALGKSVVEVITDYLERLLDHARRERRSRHGFVEGGNVQLVISIPAIWSAPAFRDMEEAVALAASRLHFRMNDKAFFVYEPDAAARYVSGGMRKHHLAVSSPRYSSYITKRVIRLAKHSLYAMLVAALL